MHSLAKIALTATLLCSSIIANAAFINTSLGEGYNNGSFNETDRMGFLRVSGGDNKGVYGIGYSQLEDNFATAGVFSFDWNLSTTSDPAKGGYLLNGTKFELGFTDGFTNKSGSTSVTLAAGDAFGWYLEVFLSRGSSQAYFNLSNASFTASPSAVPVPAAAWLFGSALLGVAGLRRKQQA